MFKFSLGHLTKQLIGAHGCRSWQCWNRIKKKDIICRKKVVHFIMDLICRNKEKINIKCFTRIVIKGRRMMTYGVTVIDSKLCEVVLFSSRLVYLLASFMSNIYVVNYERFYNYVKSVFLFHQNRWLWPARLGKICVILLCNFEKS